MELGAYLGPVVAVIMFAMWFGSDIKSIAKSLKSIAESLKKE